MTEESSTPYLVEPFRPSRSHQPPRLGSRHDRLSTDAVWDVSLQGMGVFKARDAVGGLIEDWSGVYEDSEQRVEELRDLGNGVTFRIGLMRGRLPGSAGFVELRYAVLATWVDGLIRRITSYTDIDQGLADAERLAQERG
jgi:hypothetical protein